MSRVKKPKLCGIISSDGDLCVKKHAHEPPHENEDGETWGWERRDSPPHQTWHDWREEAEKRAQELARVEHEARYYQEKYEAALKFIRCLLSAEERKP